MSSKLQEIHQNKSSFCVFIVSFDLIHPIDLLSSGTFHCVKSVRIRSYSGPHFLTFGLNTDQNNSNADIFHAVFTLHVFRLISFLI